MATRADHFKWADELVWQARRALANEYPDEKCELWLMAAQVHATLAGVPATVDEQVQATELGASKAVAAAENRFYRAPIGHGVCIECGGGPSGLHRVTCSVSRKGPPPDSESGNDMHMCTECGHRHPLITRKEFRALGKTHDDPGHPK